MAKAKKILKADERSKKTAIPKPKTVKLFLFIALVAISLLACKNTPQQVPQRTRVSSPPAPRYWTGDGGRGKSLGILVLESQGLNEALSYIPTMVQGGLVANISRYSAISVLDRIALDKVIAETLDPTYEDSDSIIRLGHIAHVGLMLTGKIIKTTTGYTLQLNITDTANAQTVASYSNNFTVAQFDNHTAIQIASKELLALMGIQLTDRAIDELNKPPSNQTINSQTALAQGITAQQRGTVIEALTYFYEASHFDPNLLEASSRLNALSNNITSGNIGENVRNEIQRRNEWVKLLTDCEIFFIKHIPFEIILDTNISQGRINYGRETVNLSCNITIAPTAGINVIQDILTGLTETGKRTEWGFKIWPMNSKMFSGELDKGLNWGTIAAYKENYITVELINSDGKTISISNVRIVNNIVFPEGENRNMGNDGVYRFYDFSRIAASSSNSIINFNNVNANDITDNLTVKITSINGIDAEKASVNGYIKISVLEV